MTWVWLWELRRAIHFGEFERETRRLGRPPSDPENLTGKWVLDGRTPRNCPDLAEWAWFMETTDRSVARVELAPGVFVSTVFLGLNYTWLGSGGLPQLFESLVMGGEHGDERLRCSTWAEAEAQHDGLVRLVRRDLLGLRVVNGSDG